MNSELEKVSKDQAQQSIKQQQNLSSSLVPLWGKLVTLHANTGHGVLQLNGSNSIIIGRSSSNFISIKDKKLSSKHCRLEKFPSGQIFLKDLNSMNGTFINDTPLGKGQVCDIFDGDELWLLYPKSQQTQGGYGFRLIETGNSKLLKTNMKSQSNTQDAALTAHPSQKQTKTKTNALQPPNVKKQKNVQSSSKSTECKQQQNKKVKQNPEKPSYFRSIRSRIVCPICCKVLTFAVQLEPCNHRICGPCLSDVVCQKQRGWDLCPYCQKSYEKVRKDTTLTDLIKSYLEQNPSDRIDPKELLSLKIKNLFNRDCVLIQELANQQICLKGYEQLKNKKSASKGRNVGSKPKAPLTAEKKGQMYFQNDVTSDILSVCEQRVPSKPTPKKLPIFLEDQGRIQYEEDDEVIEIQDDMSEWKKEKKVFQPQPQILQNRSQSGSNFKRTRKASSDISAESDPESSDRCRQCLESRKGYQCSAGTTHKTCSNCKKILAIRKQPSKKQIQFCCICDRYFCNLYYPPCNPMGSSLFRINPENLPHEITVEVMRNNKFEYDTIHTHMQKYKINNNDILIAALKNIKRQGFAFQRDKKIIKKAGSGHSWGNKLLELPPKQIILNEFSCVCSDCKKQLWFQIVFEYMRQIQSDLPHWIKSRPTCYWGINCRTMEHSFEHARKYSHFVYQTKFA